MHQGSFSSEGHSRETFIRKLYEVYKQNTSPAPTSIATDKYSRLFSDDHYNQHTFLMRKVFLQVEHRITQKIQAIFEKQKKKMKTIACQHAEMEKCV